MAEQIMLRQKRLHEDQHPPPPSMDGQPEVSDAAQECATSIAQDGGPAAEQTSTSPAAKKGKMHASDPSTPSAIEGGAVPPSEHSSPEDVAPSPERLPYSPLGLTPLPVQTVPPVPPLPRVPRPPGPQIGPNGMPFSSRHSAHGRWGYGRRWITPDDFPKKRPPTAPFETFQEYKEYISYFFGFEMDFPEEENEKAREAGYKDAVEAYCHSMIFV